MKEKLIAVNEYLVVKKVKEDVDFLSTNKTEGLTQATIFIHNKSLPGLNEGNKIFYNPMGSVNILLEGEELVVLNHNQIVLVCQ